MRNDAKILIGVKIDQKSPKSDNNWTVWDKIFQFKILFFFLEDPKSKNGSPETIFGCSESKEDSMTLYLDHTPFPYVSIVSTGYGLIIFLFSSMILNSPIGFCFLFIF